jgi:hypothetical protein
LFAACAGDQVIGQVPGGPPCPGAFTHRLSGTARGLGSGEALTDFPALVSLDAEFPYDETDGGDLVVLDAACEPLPFEIDRWDTTGSALWVRLPELPVNESVRFGIYFGDPSRRDAETPNGVFTNEFAGVYHLEDDSLEDSSVFRAVGTRRGDSTIVPAIVGRGRELAGGASVAISDNEFSDGDEPRTICAWSRSDDDGASFYYMLGYGTGGHDAGGFAMGRHGTQLNCVGGDGDYLQVVDVYPVGDRSWRYVCCVWADGTMTGYADGTPLRSEAIPGPIAHGTAHIGSGANGDGTWIGALDEVRVSGVARSDGWIAAEAASMSGRLVELTAIERIAP